MIYFSTSCGVLPVFQQQYQHSRNLFLVSSITLKKYFFENVEQIASFANMKQREGLAGG